MTTHSAQDLSTLVRGSVLEAADVEFEAACRGFNLALSHTPELVVLAAEATDVATAVRWAGDHGLSVSVHATGHGMGHLAHGGVLINTSLLQQVAIDPGRGVAQVGAGVRWQDVVEAAAPFGLAPLCGSSPTVGVVGFTMGGGMGPMARTFGFAADHVRRIDIVLADGTPTSVTDESEPELFWALRGGKCEIGIVTGLEFDLMPVPTYYGGGLFFNGKDAVRVLHDFAAWSATLPESATTSVALLRLPALPSVPEPLRGVLSLHLRFLHVGDAEQGAALLAPMRASGTPLIDTVAVTPYAQIASVHADPTDPMPAHDDSMLLTGLPGAAVDALIDAAGPDSQVPLVVVELRHMGGATARDAAVPNAVGGRDGAYNLEAVGAYPPPLRDQVDAATTAVLGALRPWATGGTQINFQGSATGAEAVRRAWPAAMLGRLQAVSQTWNPDRRFRFSYSLSE